MCTLSFLPNEFGYVVAMNRDERRARVTASPPQVFGNAIYPREPGGDGTWIAVNSSGITLALLNRNLSGGMYLKSRSRGEVIPALAGCESLSDIQRRLVELNCKGMCPFRLFAVSPNEHEVCEWDWQEQKLTPITFAWQQRHWYSSGMSDEEAERRRGAVVQQAWLQTEAGSVGWIRNLHRSHEPKRGAFSLCVHRDDASTVSYSEIMVDNTRVEFRYAGGSPCESQSFDTTVGLPRSQPFAPEMHRDVINF
jgi:Transport and Golgi organisation 2